MKEQFRLWLKNWLEVPDKQEFIDEFNRNAADVTKDTRRYIHAKINEYNRQLRKK